MNKLFIALLVFGVAVASAQPFETQEAKCAANAQAVLNIARFADRVAKGEGN